MTEHMQKRGKQTILQNLQQTRQQEAQEEKK
jgi:hypothetical protein